MDEPQYFPPWARLDARHTAETRAANAMQELSDIEDQIQRTEETRAIVRTFQRYERMNGPTWRQP